MLQLLHIFQHAIRYKSIGLSTIKRNCSKEEKKGMNRHVEHTKDYAYLFTERRRMNLVNERVNLINKLLMCHFIILTMTTTKKKLNKNNNKKRIQTQTIIWQRYLYITTCLHFICSLFFFSILEFYLQMYACCLWINRSRDHFE